MPGQSGALYAKRKLGNAGENGKFAQFLSISRRMSCHQIVKLGKDAFGFSLGFAFEHLRHHGSRGFRDGAATALEPNVVYGAVCHINIHREMVAAQRIETFRLVVRGLNHAEVLWLLAVLQNYFLVKIAQFADVRHYPSTSCTLRIPFTRASTSSRVLYRPNDARAVAGMPKRCITGWAQWCPVRRAMPSLSRMVPMSWG